MHEAICCGGLDSFQGQPLPKPGEITRCAEVEHLLLKEIPANYRSQYVEKRIEMFKTLLERRLNPKFDKMFEHSLKFLKEVKK